MDSDKNHVTYSTCYSEGNTGLIYYTYRHYAPRLHKWINKDPIAEEGGLNLYQMVGNDTIGNLDILGYAVKRCAIEIVVGHGSRWKSGSDVGITLASNADIAKRSGLLPGEYATGGVSCADGFTNKYSKEYGYNNDNRTYFPRLKWGLESAIDKEIEAAKKHASSKMIPAPICCEEVEITVEFLIRGETRFWFFEDPIHWAYNKLKEKYKNPIYVK